MFGCLNVWLDSYREFGCLKIILFILKTEFGISRKTQKLQTLYLLLFSPNSELIFSYSQLRITFPHCPLSIISNPCWNSSIPKRCVITGFKSNPDISICSILYQVSHISRP